MKDMDDKTIYVGGLPYDCTESHLRRVFELYGSIINLKIINDRNTGGKCYGFVTFKNPRSAVEAINEMNGGTIGGRVVRVSEATIRGAGGRANYGNENLRRNSRNLEWENRGREIENAYRRDRQCDSSWEHDGERKRRRNYSRDCDNSRDHFQGRDRGQSRDFGEWEKEQGRFQKRSHDRDHFQGRDRGQSRDLGEWEEEQVRVQKRSRDWEGERNDGLNAYPKDRQRNISHEHDGERERRHNYSRDHDNSSDRFQGRDRGQSRDLGEWGEEQRLVQKRSDWEGERNVGLNAYHKDIHCDSFDEQDGGRERRLNYSRDRDNSRDRFQGRDRGQSSDLGEWEEEQGQVLKRSIDWEGEINDDLNAYHKDGQCDSSHEHDGERERRRNYSRDSENSRDHFQGRDRGQSRELGEWEEQGGVQKRSHDSEGEINDDLNAYHKDRQRDSSHEHDGERKKRHYSRDRDNSRDNFQGRDQGQSMDLGEWQEEQERVQTRSLDWEGERNDGDRQRDSSHEHDGGRERRRNYSRDRNDSKDHFQGRDSGQSGNLGEWEEEQGWVQKRSHDSEGERNDGLNDLQEKELDNVDHPDRRVDKNKEHHLKRQNSSSSCEQQSRDFSSESSDYQYQVEEKLDLLIKRRDELQNENSEIKKRLEEKKQMTVDLERRSLKLEDSLVSAKKQSSERQLQLTKLYTCFQQVKEYGERLRSSENELQDLVASVSVEFEADDDFDAKDVHLTNGRF